MVNAQKTIEILFGSTFFLQSCSPCTYVLIIVLQKLGNN